MKDKGTTPAGGGPFVCMGGPRKGLVQPAGLLRARAYQVCGDGPRAPCPLVDGIILPQGKHGVGGARRPFAYGTAVRWCAQGRHPAKVATGVSYADCGTGKIVS